MKILRYKNIKIFLNYILGPILFLWLTGAVVRQIQNQPHLEASWYQIKASFSSLLLFYLLAVVLLMLVNWSLEALKWKLTVKTVQPVSFLRALKAVFSGVSFSVSMPNRMGEYLGRILYMNEGNRLKVISLTLMCSISQLLITLFFGLAGLLILKSKIIQSGISGQPVWVHLVLTGGCIGLFFLTVFYFNLGWFVKTLDKLPFVRKYGWLIRELQKLNRTLLLQLLALSAMRYFVFGLQYLLLFRFFGVEVSAWQGFWALAIVFLIMAALPAIALFEVVQKIFITKEIFALFTVNTLGISFVTTTIWFVNLVIPAAVGSLLILGLKTFRKENENS
jgi:hypothetical protein